jgi:predicted aspartyl protease
MSTPKFQSAEINSKFFQIIRINRLLHQLVIASAFVLISMGYAYAEEVQLVRSGGVFTLPVRINGNLVLPFILDSGAADVSIPIDVALTLERTGTITDDDFIGTKTYSDAQGHEFKSDEFFLREMQIGNYIVEKVVAGIVPAAGDPLLGQSFLSRLPTWAIDNSRHVLILGGQTPSIPPSPIRRTGFLFPHSDQQPISVGDLQVLSCDQLTLARNEIYARNGRYFQRADLKGYFGRFDWYHPSSWDPAINPIERENVQTIQRVEGDKGCK